MASDEDLKNRGTQEPQAEEKQGETAGSAASETAGTAQETGVTDQAADPYAGMSKAQIRKAEKRKRKAAKKAEKKKSPWRGFKRGIACGAAAVILLEIYLALRSSSGNRLDLFEILRKTREIEAYIDHTYLYDADKQDITDGMFAGMIYGLTEDNYSAYYSASDFAEEQKRLNGNYVGIGVTISKDEETGGILVNAVNPDGPAARAGILEGDIFTEADGHDLTALSVNDAVGIITGELGTTVDIRLMRGSEELEFIVERENIVTVSVQSGVIDKEDSDTIDSGTGILGTDVGYISVTAFNQTTLQEFMEELDYLTQDAQVDGIIIDLRNNGGGDMNICLDMLDLVLYDDLEVVNKYTEEDGEASKDDTGTDADSGTLLLSVEDKYGDADKYYAVDKTGTDVPVVVVVNGNSASASEIFAGTLRDYGYQVVGEKTYGKGIVQSLYTLSDSSAVKFTTQQYRLAGGELIHGKGITPTIEVEFEEYDGITEDMVNAGDGSIQPDLVKDKQIAAAVAELKRQVYEEYNSR